MSVDNTENWKQQKLTFPNITNLHHKFFLKLANIQEKTPVFITSDCFIRFFPLVGTIVGTATSFLFIDKFNTINFN